MDARFPPAEAALAIGDVEPSVQPPWTGLALVGSRESSWEAVGRDGEDRWKLLSSNCLNSRPQGPLGPGAIPGKSVDPTSGRLLAASILGCQATLGGTRCRVGRASIHRAGPPKRRCSRLLLPALISLSYRPTTPRSAGHRDMVDRLLRYGADPNVRDTKIGKLAEDWADDGGYK